MPFRKSFASGIVSFLKPKILLYSDVDITLFMRDIKLIQLETSVSFLSPHNEELILSESQMHSFVICAARRLKLKLHDLSSISTI